jgi:ParB-like chromosome segregation protein Spo0J
VKVALVPIGQVVPYEHNPRRHEAAVAKVAGSLREFGWRQPIVVDRNMVVVVGHARLAAAQMLGMAEVPVHIASDLSENQARAYRIADNRTNEESDWDRELLALELGDLAHAGIELALTGFDGVELEELRLIGADGFTDPDETPAVPAVPVTRSGDLWMLGLHRVLCGGLCSSPVSRDNPLAF